MSAMLDGDHKALVPMDSVAPGRRSALQRMLLVGAAAFIGLSLIRFLTGANDLTSGGTVNTAILSAVPIALAGLAGLWSERSGVVNIGLEGMLVLGTWGAGFAGYQWGPWAALVAGGLCGSVGGALHALATVTFGVDQVVSGVAINLLAPGAALYLNKLMSDRYQNVSGSGGGDKQSPRMDAIQQLSIPGAEGPLKDLQNKQWFLLSDIAGVLRGVFVGTSILVVVTVLMFVATWFILWRTAFGLRLRSCGEAPYAAESLGVNVYRYKYIAVMASGFIAGIGGGALAVIAGLYKDGQTGGRGYIGLAAMIFGNWRPGGLATGAGLFGYTDALKSRQPDSVKALLLILGILLVLVGGWRLFRYYKQPAGFRIGGVGTVIGHWLTLAIGLAAAIGYFFTDAIPTELVSATPYVATLIVLVLATKSFRMPKADGQVYRRGAH
ncbi:MAG: Nucleoside transporter, permease protein 2 [Jatrophihabitantaceae bacterium]|nr:Nucleoside transporter, permease protein 2 [Jatrophihabitantaceae bacterium]